jgi:hypothetical protein
MYKSVLMFLVFVIFTCSINAQELINKNPFWLNGSIGGSSKYLNVSASYNKAFENISYQVSINGTKMSILSNYGMTTGNVGIGFAHYKDWLISSFYLGPSLSYGEALTKSKEPTYFWGAGLAFNAQAYFMPLHKLFPGVGLGVELFYNLNAIQVKDVDYRNVYSVRLGFCITNIHEE